MSALTYVTIHKDISSGGESVGEVTYGEAFGTSLVTKTMTGDMIRRLQQQQQQFLNCGGQNPNAATCEGKICQITINGTAVKPTDTFRVTMNNFLATGGDGFAVFNEGTNALGGAQDIDSFAAYLTAAGPAGVAVPPLDRVTAIP